ncbi:MAG: class I SAM-dependent methyltransferase [Azoarcus sp.]|jgi:SAM-dependent methyltransferase|nr:class I SAM-dependent methyltransferase [Azoarcus sp.]
MPGAALLYHLARDWLSREESPRIPESALMDESAAAHAFLDAGAHGQLAPTYLYHAIQASALIAPGARVVDLGCGPAVQLALMARLAPAAHFIGIECAPAMLALAHDYLRREGTTNVILMKDDMTRLDGIASASVDTVVSTMALHHLPNPDELAATFATIHRILKPGGSIYVVDFGRLKRKASMYFFAHEHAREQSPHFTADYHHSLAAAFSLDDWRAASQTLRARDGIRLVHTFLVPFLVALRGPVTRAAAPATLTAARGHYATLSSRQRRAFHDLARFFARGGLELPFKPQIP